jgi:hypothetical protein
VADPRPPLYWRRLDQGRQVERGAHAAEGMGRMEGARLLEEGRFLQHVHATEAEYVVVEDRARPRHCSNISLYFHCYELLFKYVDRTRTKIKQSR